MRLGSARSWRISLEQWSAPHECALWLRAAERIPVPAGGLVPGPLDIHPVPARSSASGDALAEDWARWWRELVLAPAWRPERDPWPPPQAAYFPPDFPGLAAWPGLRRMAVARGSE